MGEYGYETDTRRSKIGDDATAWNDLQYLAEPSNAATATALETARTLRTDLSSTAAASFDGTADATPGVTGTLPVSNGGTGATTLTGIIKGSGTSALSAAAAGTDYVAPGGALGTPSSGNLANCTGLPVAGITGTLPVASGGTGATTLTGIVKGSGASAFAAAVAGVDYADPAIDSMLEPLTVGQSTMPRMAISAANLPSGNGNLRVTYFTARKSETVTQVRVPCGTAAVGATLARIGLYSVDPGTGDLTLVASTPNDTGLWIVANTAYTKAFSASYAVTRGSRYAVGLIVVGTSTAPVFMGTGPGGASTEFGVAPRLCAVRTGRTDLDATIAAANLSDTTGRYYAVLLP